MIVEVFEGCSSFIVFTFRKCVALTFLFMCFYERIQANGLQKRVSVSLAKLVKL